MLRTRGQLQLGLQVLPLHHADVEASCWADMLCGKAGPDTTSVDMGEPAARAALGLQRAPMGLTYWVLPGLTLPGSCAPASSALLLCVLGEQPGLLVVSTVTAACQMLL